MMTLARDDRMGGRRTARVITDADITNMATRAVNRAVETGKLVITCRHGGSVANKYGYPAHTDAVLVAAFGDGFAVAWASHLPANKVSLGGAAHACFSCARPLFDARITDRDRIAAARAAVEAAARLAVAEGKVWLVVPQEVAC